MQRLVYTVDIDDEIILEEAFLSFLDMVIEDQTDCSVIRSRIENDESVVENGEWEDE